MTTRPSRFTASAILRFFSGLFRGLLIYALLIGGSLIFTLPFLWMLGTSFKVDREMFGEEITLMPSTPVPAAASPFLDEQYFKQPAQPEYERVRGVIVDRLRNMVIPVPDHTANGERAAEILAPGVFRKLWDTVPAASWQKTDDELFAEVRERITDEMVKERARRVFRHMAFGPVRVRSVELQESEVTAGMPISQFWEVETSQQARLLDDTKSSASRADLVYDFGDANNGEITLSRTVDLPFKADRLSRIQISIRPDDSWHAIEFYVEMGGKLYRGERPEFAGNFESKVVSLQEYGPDDLPDSSKIRHWIAYKQVDEGEEYESGESRVAVSMVITRNSRLGAWWAKCHRNYRTTLSYIPFWRFASTSAFLVLLNIIGNIVSCSLVAYAFARLAWPGRNFCFGLMLATLMIPPQVTMIPFFLIIKYLGWYNTLKPLWVISFFGNAFNVFLLRQFMKGIPRDLEDAAKIDGCNFLHIYWYVIVPLIKPTLAVIAIFTFMAVWNDFMGPLIYLADQRLYPLSLGLYALNVTEGGQFGMLMAGSVMMTLPVIVIFFVAQKYFIQGITLTGMKG